MWIGCVQRISARVWSRFTPQIVSAGFPATISGFTSPWRTIVKTGLDVSAKSIAHSNFAAVSTAYRTALNFFGAVKPPVIETRYFPFSAVSAFEPLANVTSSRFGADANLRIWVSFPPSSST